MKFRTYYKKYPVNNTDNIRGDYSGLLEIQIREDPAPVAVYTILLSDKGIPPKFLSNDESLQAKANTFYED